MQPLPVQRSSIRSGLAAVGVNKSATRRTQSSVSGRGIKVGGRVFSVIEPNGWLPARLGETASDRFEVHIPRMYCSGSPWVRLSTILARSNLSCIGLRRLLWSSCCIHFSSRLAVSRPSDLNSCVNSAETCGCRGINYTGSP